MGKVKFQDALGRTFVRERDDLAEIQFDTDSPDAGVMVGAHADWLQENGCEMEAELLQLHWGVKIGTIAWSTMVQDRIKELQEYFEIQQTRRINKQARILGPRGLRQQLITLYLEDPLGQWFSKATVNLLHMEEFLPELHANPIISLCLACNGTSAPGLIHKYLNYRWLRKVFRLELNNFEVGFTMLRDLFKNTVIQPQELVITGRVDPQRRIPTKEQFQLLPTLCPNLKNIWSLTYHGRKYDYRTGEMK